MRAFVFPGQGSQAVGMGRALYDAVPAARVVFEEVDDALGSPLSRLIFYGPEETLRLTENAQPALMATSLAVLRALEARSDRALAELCRVVAGHSLGEYSALAAAGSLALGDAARLLRVRGRAMQNAVPVGEGAMAAILGLELGAVEEVALRASEIGVCDLANDNAPGQAVVSGDRAAVERAVELAREQGARRSVLLPVSA
ncbi:MAG TPA: ACP S-malonyltransferase, partial [Geminicoccaceae bacterium]